MDNKFETDEEKEARIRREILAELKQEGYNTENQEKDKMRKDILDELNNSDTKNNPMANSNIQSFGPPKKTSKVSFNRPNNNIVNNTSVREETNNTMNEVGNNSNGSSDPKGGNSFIVLGSILALLVIAFIYFLPQIKNMTSKDNKPKPISTSNKEEKKVEIEKLTLKSDEVKNAKYPVLHVNSANKNTYLKLDSVSVSNLSNNDILYNALIDVYDGSMASYRGSYDSKFCGTSAQKVYVDYRYVELRVEGAFSRNTKYSHNNITVPVNNPKTKYVGVWKYNKKGKYYVYYGNCNQKSSNILYLDINSPYDVDNKLIDEKYKIKEMYLYNYIGFVVLNTSNKNYTIYSDANYTKKVSSGVLKTNNYETELKEIVGNIGKDSLNKYMYTYSNNNCPYMDYCFKSGQWVK